jgi:light-regulated signal transduction histidine kinase (bacteriophytochrome)
MNNQDYDLHNCELEPIQIPNKIQPFGFLLAVHPVNLEILQCSENVGAFLPFSAGELLGKSLKDLLRKADYQRIFKALSGQNIETVNPMSLFFVVDQQEIAYDTVVHLSDEMLVLEFEFPQEDKMSYAEFYHSANRVIEGFQQSDNLGELCHIAAEKIRDLTGYDRVMIYRFDHEWNGEVIAESKESYLNTFLNLHFPSTDIPPQARQLYLKNWTRIIEDVDYKPSEVIPAINPKTNQFLDLSFSFLRSVSPLHIEYLQNMGVRATLTISIIHDDQLWGLVACHHYSPRWIDFNKRKSAEFIGKIFSYYLHQKAEKEDLQFATHIKENEAQLIKQLAGAERIEQALCQQQMTLLDINSASGAVIVYDNSYHSVGTLPDENFVANLITWLPQQMRNGYYSTDSLGNEMPQAASYSDTASGILAISLGKSSAGFVIWFKPERIQTVNWGGNPTEKYASAGVRLSPRKSFEKWEQVVKLRATPWQANEVEVARSLRVNLLEVMATRSAQLRRQNEELQQRVEAQTKTLKDTNQHLRSTLAQLGHQHKQLKDIAYLQSHKVRSPVATLMGLVQLIDEKEMGPDNKQLINYIKSTTLQLDKVIRKIIRKIYE